ncbi:hypothetical protein [Pseudomonas sp. BN411]|uniref:hypothetical protein n=1 Tax=Pseudomonas sp. BN411 TaxID=2567887 RepID=UPI00245400E9|nr:hypothetical protein [Pseudomonas sp. BN411]MDH4559610.1 hypothetical protein [Pseudomonas sp. BN411]
MKAWLGVALACSAGVAALACATVLLTPAPQPVSASRPIPPPIIAPAPPLPVAPPAPALPAEGRGRPLAVASSERETPSLDQAEAIQLMQWMSEKGDPRSPTLGGLKPRQAATAAELADPRQYAALEERQTRELLQAYAGGVQQIPEIRARIEAAEQSGERSVSELDEARAALEQLEAMKGRLESEAPQLLPEAGTQAPAKDR